MQCPWRAITRPPRLATDLKHSDFGPPHGGLFYRPASHTPLATDVFHRSAGPAQGRCRPRLDGPFGRS